MGLVPQAIHRGRSRVLGIILITLICKEITRETIGVITPMADMDQRKTKMARPSDCFSTLPGRNRTLEELLEVITLGNRHTIMG